MLKTVSEKIMDYSMKYTETNCITKVCVFLHRFAVLKKPLKKKNLQFLINFVIFFLVETALSLKFIIKKNCEMNASSCIFFQNSRF